MPERGGYESKFLREGIDYLLLQYHKELSSPYRWANRNEDTC